MTFVTGDNNFSVSKWIVSPTPGQGTHTTISAAITSASSGDTIMIKPGTYNENLTISKNLIFFSLDGPSRDTANDNTRINGNITLSGTDLNVEIDNILLEAPSGTVFTSTGANCEIAINSCTILAGTGVGFTIDGGSNSNLYLNQCYCTIGAGGKLFNIVNGVLWFYNSQAIDINATAIASTVAGGFYIANSYVGFRTDISTAFSYVTCRDTQFGSMIVPAAGGVQAFSFTGASVGANFVSCYFNPSGNICMSIDAGVTVNMTNCEIAGTRFGNVITGTGTLKCNNVTFYNSTNPIAGTITLTNFLATTTPVGNGGTGKTSLTAYGTLVGGTTTTNPVQVVSPGTSGQVLTSQGSSAIPVYADAAAVTTTTFNASGTWTKKANTKFVGVYVFNGGAGGGSGRRSTSTNAGGGGAGGGGAYAYYESPASFFGATETVTIGAAALGGAAQTVDDTDGNDGQTCTLSSFGNLTAFDPSAATGAYGRGGSTGSVFGGSGSSAPLWICSIPGAANDGGTGELTDGAQGTDSTVGRSGGATGGGGGGGADSVVIRSGGRGGDQYDATGSFLIINGGAGGSESGTIDGANGTDQPTGATASGIVISGSGGGGGGGQSAGLVAGNGGHGGVPGGGGGGGGGSLNGTNSGAGGDGGQGKVIVIEFA